MPDSVVELGVAVARLAGSDPEQAVGKLDAARLAVASSTPPPVQREERMLLATGSTQTPVAPQGREAEARIWLEQKVG